MTDKELIEICDRAFGAEYQSSSAIFLQIAREDIPKLVQEIRRLRLDNQKLADASLDNFLLKA